MAQNGETGCKRLETLAGGTLDNTGWDLGPWFLSSNDRWLWGYDPTTEELFHREGVAWTVWRPKGRKGLRRTSKTFVRVHLVQQLPMGLQWVTVSRSDRPTEAKITGQAIILGPPITEGIDTLDQRLQWFHYQFPREAWILDEIDLVGDPRELVRSIQAGTACAISDGSFNDRKGAAGFRVICRKTGTSLTGRHSVQGSSAAQSAYRSELSGILGIQTLVRLLDLHYGIKTGGVTLACDGLPALQQAFYEGPARPTKPDFDLIHTIRTNFKRSTLKWTSQHV